RVGGVGRAEAPAAQNRYLERLEEAFVDGIHRGGEVFAIARHREAVRHEGDAFEALQPERRVPRESGALDAERFPRALGQKLVELPRLRRVVLHQARIEPRHQNAVFRKTDSAEQAVLETAEY